MSNVLNDLKKMYKDTNKATIIIRVSLVVLVIFSLIRQIMLKEYNNAFLCILTLILFAIPTLLQRRLKIVLPNTLETIILCFIFSAEILGEINNFYIVIPYWDTILHTLNGFIAAGIGFSLVDILNKNFDSINLSPLFIAVVAFCFSMTVGALWEIFEYSADGMFSKDMQKDDIVTKISTVELDETRKNKVVTIDNIEYTVIYSKDSDGNMVETVIEGGYLDIGINDTMQDLIVNFIGATIFSIFGYLYIVNVGDDKYIFVERFIPKKENKK